MKIGSKISSLRKSKKMTLQQLSDASGVALATLSRMENNKMTGTLESHMSIAKSLGASLSEFYSDIGSEEKNVDLKTKGISADVFVHSDKSSYEMLTKNVLSKKMMPILLKIEPSGKTNPEEASFETEKFIFVLEGELIVVISDKEYKIKEPESLYFKADQSHYFKNNGKVEARALCVITPPSL